MKFRSRLEKGNLLLMSSILFLLIVTCIFWIILREYIYCAIYFALTLLIAYTYFFTFYYIKENSIIIKLGIIKFKVKYSSIIKIEDCNDKVKIYLKYIRFTIYPNNQDIFIAKLNSKLTNKNSYTIIK